MLSRLFGSLAPELAIDLGSANTLVAAVGQGVIVDEPSVVAVEKESGQILADGAAVGHLARQMLGRTPGSISVVRPVQAGVINDFELCQAMLRTLLRKARRGRPGLGARVLVAAPGNISAVEKRAIFASFERVGASEVLVMPQAQAAAIGAGLPVAEPVASMICDIGSGATEVAILSMGRIVAQQSLRVAGDVMDVAISDYLRRRHSLRIGPSEAERVRISVGSAWPTGDELMDEVRGVDAISALPRKVVMTSEELRAPLAEPLMLIVDAIRQTLDACPPELGADLIDNGLALSGGGSLLRGLDLFLQQHTGLPTRVVANPQSAVVHGALACLEQRRRWRGILETSSGRY